MVCCRIVMQYRTVRRFKSGWGKNKMIELLMFNLRMVAVMVSDCVIN